MDPQANTCLENVTDCQPQPTGSPSAMPSDVNGAHASQSHNPLTSGDVHVTEAAGQDTESEEQSQACNPPVAEQQVEQVVESFSGDPSLPAPRGRLFYLLQEHYRILWQGYLFLKNKSATVQMHYLFGNWRLAKASLPCNADGSTPPIRITQRMRLDPARVEEVKRKLQLETEHCILVALPCGRHSRDVLYQSFSLQVNFAIYLQKKTAAGVINVSTCGPNKASFVIYIFPDGEFVSSKLARIAPELLSCIKDIAYVLVIIVKA